MFDLKINSRNLQANKKFFRREYVIQYRLDVKLHLESEKKQMIIVEEKLWFNWSVAKSDTIFIKQFTISMKDRARTRQFMKVKIKVIRSIEVLRI